MFQSKSIMSGNKISCLVKSIQRSSAIARCFDVQIPKFHYSKPNQAFDSEKYNEDLNAIIRFNKHPVVVKCYPIHWSNVIPNDK